MIAALSLYAVLHLEPSIVALLGAGVMVAVTVVTYSRGSPAPP